MKALVLFLVLALGCAGPRGSAPGSEAGPVASLGLLELGDVTEESAQHLLQEVELVTRSLSPGQEVRIRINSFGGSIFAGLDLIQAVEDLKRVRGFRTVCLVDTRAMSMGAVFLQSGACDRRLMTVRSVILLHNGSTRSQGTADKLEEDANLIRALSGALSDLCALRMGMDPNALRARLSRGAWTLDWREALRVGAVDAVVP